MASVEAVPLSDSDHNHSEHGVKRRQSEDADEAVDSKRQRTCPGKNSPTAPRDDAADKDDKHDTPTEDTKPPSASDKRRKSSAVDEKQRSKRLFGALLGNLRQPGDRTSKRRQEIEERRKAELARQDDERLEDRQRRQEHLVEQRKMTQVKVNEQNVGSGLAAMDHRKATFADMAQMHRRHKAMLDKANFLQTETEPKLFYRPWDLRDEEEDCIDDQIKDVRDAVDKEVAEFNEHQEQKGILHNGTSTLDADPKDANPRVEDNAKDDAGLEAKDEVIVPQNGEEGSGQDRASAKSEQGDNTTTADAPDTIPATNDDATNVESNGQKEERPGANGEGEDGGDEGEHVQEGDEDAVIY